MEESAPMLTRAPADGTATAPPTVAATAAARRATAKRAAAPLTSAQRVRDASAPAVPMPTVTAGPAAPIDAAAVPVHTSATAAGLASATTSAARVRRYGRLKSFSSRQRMTPGRQRPAGTGTAALPSSTKTTRGAQSRRWNARQATVPVDASVEREQPLATATAAVHSRGNSNRREQPDADEETKDSESHSTASLSPQLEQTRPLQRMQCVQLKCTAHPELVLPYLYGDRKSRINTIMLDTGCTIDYCPMSPGDEAQSPQTKAYLMNFLISAETASSLEEAIRMLRALVEKVEAHLEKKRRIRSLHMASSGSMTPSGAYRSRDVERSSGAHYSDDSQESVQFTGAYEADAGNAGNSTSSSTAQRMDDEQQQQQSPRARQPNSPVALETPLDAYRQHRHASVRRRPDDVHRHKSHHERLMRLAVPYDDEDDDMVLYDRWGRPVLRHDRSIDSSAFESAPSGDASADVAHRPVVQSVPVRVPRRRHWSYSDESEWRAPSRGFAHVSPPAANERVPSPPSSARRVQAPLRRRYVPYPYHYSDIVYDDAGSDAYASERRGHADGLAPAAMMQPEERYSDFEREDSLEREDELLAAQEYAMSSSARAQALYAVRRSDVRRSAHFRDASPPRYAGKRAALSSASAHYAREYFDGDWLSGDDDEYDDDDEVMFHRYPHYPAAASPYPPPHLQATSRAMTVSPSTRKPLKDVTIVYAARESKRTAMACSCKTYESLVTHRSSCRDSADAHSESQAPAADEVVLKSVSDHDEPVLDEQQQGSGDKSHEIQECDVVSDRETDAEQHARDVSMSDTSVDTPEIGRAAHAGEPTPVDTELMDATGTSTAPAPPAPQTELSRASPLEHAPDESALAVAGAVAQSTQTTVTQHANWRVRANALLAAALERDSVLDAACVEAERAARAQLKKYAALESKRQVLAQLDALSTSAYELQCLVVSANCRLDLSVRREMLRLLDDAVQASVRAASTPTNRLASLRAGVEQALALATIDAPVDANPSLHDEPRDGSRTDGGVTSSRVSPTTDASGPESSAKSVEEPLPTLHDSASVNNNWSDGGEWFESADELLGTASVEPDAPLAEPTAAPSTPTASLALKTVDGLDDNGSRTAATSESVSLYPSTLFSAISACSPTSFVMKGMQKRLFGDIARANAYYYLHTVDGTSSYGEDNGADTSAAAPVARPPCDFGCATSATAGAVQKVVAQISSRMKWFDEITYALARARSGGADAPSERLSRKKMNSTIRKLHLMAIQLHCLVSHMYCVRGRAACSERSSLHAALNSSFFEKRMIAYKAKLKLDSDLHGAPDELLRDTFEFFPEFLLCVEMWGYDYRECSSSAPSPSHGDVGKIRTGSKALPLAFFARVESAVLDYDSDANGHLHAICEELLAIVCLWNDFVWGDNLEHLSLERIATFEAEMKRSSAKILQTYSLHLMGSWAIRLMANPDELQSLRFTQQNAYYAESSKMRGVVASLHAAAPLASTSGSAKAPSDGDHIDDDDRETVSAYWKQKLDDGELDKREALSAPLRPETIERWSKAAASAHLLKWSRVFQLRGELETCGVVLSDFVSDVVRSSPSTDKDDDSDDASSERDAMALLELFAKARVLGADVATTCETIALHSASTQLPQEVAPQTTDGAPAAASVDSPATTAPAPRSDAVTRTTRTGARANAASPSSPTDLSSGAALPQPDVKDLVQILASTRKEVDEIFCARTRSGRTRKRLQVQSLQLAQQTLEVFHTIAALRSS